MATTLHCKATCAAVAGGFAAGIAFTILFRRTWVRQASPRHPKGTDAFEIEEHILKTQVPARALGIVVDAIDNTSLTLSAPLQRNRNVHGTAFAGSLYSVSVLCAYYLGRAWVVREGLAGSGYELVAKAGRIQYKRPVTAARIVAKSILPSEAALARFRSDLEASGKASVEVVGTILGPDGRVACEYAIDVCGFRPRCR